MLPERKEDFERDCEQAARGYVEARVASGGVGAGGRRGVPRHGVRRRRRGVRRDLLQHVARGYLEVITDPSYAGQIITMTYPQIGNYGVNPDDAQAGRPALRGLVVRDICATPSNWRSTVTLADYLREHGVVAVEGVDTRALVRKQTTYMKQVRPKKKERAFVPAGQSTQMIVGASPESDFQILNLSAALYRTLSLKRVFFSAYMPVNDDARLPGADASSSIASTVSTKPIGSCGSTAST